MKLIGAIEIKVLIMKLVSISYIDIVYYIQSSWMVFFWLIYDVEVNQGNAYLEVFGFEQRNLIYVFN